MKRFYNNTKMSGVFSKTLRVIALLCVLMGFSSSAWGATCYIDATSITEAGNTVLVNWFKERQTNNDISVTEVTTGVWSFEYPSVELKIEFKINNDYKQKEPISVSNKNCIKFTYENGGLNYTWTERNPYMGMTVYFEPGDEWRKDGVWFAAYFSDGSKHAWKKLTNSICDPYNFVTTTPTEDGWDYSKLKINFCRMDPTSEVLSWDNVFNQTNDQTISLEITPGTTIDTYNYSTIWAQIYQPWGDGEDGHTWATVKWYTTDCTEQAEDYSLAGTFNNWSVKAHKFRVGKGASGSVEVELTEGSYRFKLVKNENVWYGNSGTITSVTPSSGFEFTGDGGDCTITAEQDGVYTFTFGENWMNDGKGGKKSGMWLTVTYGQAKEPVLLADPASYDVQKTQVTLSAYIQNTYCIDGAVNEGGQITDWGFVICPGTATSACTPTTTSAAKSPTPRDPKFRGEIFEHTLEADNLVRGAMYGYRGYVKIGGKMYLTKETGTFFFPGDCTQQEIDDNKTPIKYTIDASLGEDYADDCNLRYGSLQVALNRLRELSKDDNVDPKYKYATYDKGNESLNLNVPIEFHVAYYDDTPDDASKAYCYEGDTKAGVSGGGTSSENSMALIIKDINRNLGDEDERYTLTIKGANEKSRPWLHHVIVRNSKDVILDNLAIFSDPTNSLQDDALEFDCNSKEWHTLKVGDIQEANVVVKNCLIGSNGFTGVHASAYDGITFENNEFEAIMATTGDLANAVAWGASAKFIACENIKFIRNNFRGAHATLVWIQDTQNALFMNNVFWNTNQYEADCSAIRLVEQFSYGPTKNVGFYYNTFYLADGKINKDHKYDFLHTSDKGGSESGKLSSITFQYNNCYSYDVDAPGKSSSEPDGLSNSTLCPNNFWSVNPNAKFAFGTCTGQSANIVVNVSEIVCETSATGPASLVIKGGQDKSGNSLNVGKKPTIDEIEEATGQIVSEEDLTYDRYNKGARPNDDTWTYGAYQGKEDITVHTIYWVGVNENWDDRNNWAYYESDIVLDSKSQSGDASIQGRSAAMQRLSCINNLANDLKVIIPENPLVQLEGGRKWPQLPTSFNSTTRKSESGIPVSEQVTTMDGKKFADNIEVEYGAAIKGIEHLVNGNDHYGSATTHFIAPRSEWILVGTVVKPWIDPDDIAKGTRDMKSGDYYIDGRTPNVYVHQVVLENGNPTWNTPFSSLEEPLEAGKVFAMMVPDEYGTYKLPMQYYKQLVDPNATFDPTEPIVYGKYKGSKGPFTGRFVNEKPVNQGYPISYNNLSSGPNLLNNSYTYNIDAKKVEDKSEGTIQYYDSEARAFFTTSSTPGDVILKPQHGFIFTPKSGETTLNIEYGMFNDGNTRSRAAVEELPTFSLNLYNANANSGYSNIAVRMDEFLGEGNQSEMDVEKAFVNLSGTPELYIIAYDSKYSRVDYFSTEQPIPLGVRLKESMNVRFEKAWFRGFTEATLFDKLTGKEYDLLNRTYTTETLQAGDIEGRFFLNLSDNEIYVPDDEEEEGDDTPTSVEENTEDTNSINIFLRESDSTIRVITNGVELRNIYISDMTGKTMSYNVSGYFAEINLPVAQGVYMIHVVGETASRTEKVILK